MTGTGVQGSVLTSSDINWNSGQQYCLLVDGIDTQATSTDHM